MKQTTRSPKSRKDTNHEKAKRLFFIAEALRLKPYTSRQMLTLMRQSPEMAYMNVELRSVQRALQDLVNMEICRTQEADSRRYEHTDPARSSLTKPEALATHAAVRLLYHHSPGHNTHYAAALKKITLQLPQSLREIVEASTAGLQQRTIKVGVVQVLERIAQAWEEKRVLQFTYQKPNKTKEQRRFKVFFIEVSRSNLGMYVIGQDVGSSKIKTLKLSRISEPKIDTNAKPYSIPKNFDPQRFLSNAWGVIGDENPIMVKLQFAAHVTAWLEPHMPGAEPPQTLANGDVVLTIRTGANEHGEPLELIPWIRGWGAGVNVLEPDSLRQAWLAEAQKLLELHGGNKNAKSNKQRNTPITGGRP